MTRYVWGSLLLAAGWLGKRLGRGVVASPFDLQQREIIGAYKRDRLGCCGLGRRCYGNKRLHTVDCLTWAAVEE
jgi:hypothetical protein